MHLRLCLAVADFCVGRLMRFLVRLFTRSADRRQTLGDKLRANSAYKRPVGQNELKRVATLAAGADLAC